MLDKMNNKISAINKTNEGLAKIKADLTKKLNLIYELMTELQDEIYSDDSWLRLVESDTIDAIAEEAFNIVWKALYEKKNRINAEMIMIVKHKDIDGYVSELAVQQTIDGAIDHIMSEINNETNMIVVRLWSDYTSKIIVSRDFGGNKYSKNIIVTIKIK